MGGSCGGEVGIESVSDVLKHFIVFLIKFKHALLFHEFRYLFFSHSPNKTMLYIADRPTD